MADLHSPHDNTDIRINSKINFYGPVILSVTGPLMLLVLIFFGLWAFTSWSRVGLVAAVVVYGGLAMVGLALLAGIGALWVKWVIIPLIHAGQRYMEARGQDKRNKLIHIQDNAAVIENEKGHLEVIPLLTMQQRDIFHHKPELLPQEAESIGPPLPDFVRYEDIKSQIPRGHTLIGVGAGDKVLTKDKGARAMVWIVGNSGTGKTNTVSRLIDEDYEEGAMFLGVDPHFFKDDSLAHAIGGTQYESRFRTPTGNPFENGTRFASEIEDIDKMCDAFLDTFESRRSGKPWTTQLRLVMDEVSTLTYKPLTQQEKDLVAKIQRCAQVAGQQARDFGMGCIMISQQATGMAWLRRFALMVIAHQLLMMNERELACNGDVEQAKAMTNWPVGRTCVYGIAMSEGMQEVQQPVMNPPRKNFFPSLIADFPEDDKTTGKLLDNTSEDDGKTFRFAEDERSTVAELYRAYRNINKVLKHMKKSARYHADAARIIKESEA